MTATASRLMFRWSSARDCPRKAVYEATGADARELYADERGYLDRGKDLGRIYANRLIAAERGKGHAAFLWVDSGEDYWVHPNYRAETRDRATHIAEMQVQWEHGVGHPDLFVVATGTVIEVVSATQATGEYKHGKLIQACGYAEHLDGAKDIALVVVNPSNYTEERTIILRTSTRYLDLQREAKNAVDEIDAWGATGFLPQRVCQKPSEARGHFCRYADTCFAGWDPPTLEEIEADEDLIVAVAEFDTAKRARRELADTDKAWKTRQDDAQTLIEQAELPAGEDIMVGPFKLRRTSVVRKPTLDWERAESAGCLNVEVLGEFFKPGSSYSTFRTERIDMSGDEFGDKAPF